MGESQLVSWCAQRGISANKAHPDRTGWDFLVEYPADADDTVALDKQPAPIQCLVQVKATDGTSGRCNVKLTNWWRLVKTPLPAFFLVFEFDGHDTCQRAYCIHVWERQIKRVLKTLRKLTASGKPDTIHKKTMALTWEKHDMLPTHSVDAFTDAVERAIDGTIEAYTQRKQKLLETVGYEDLGHELNLHVLLPNEYRQNPDDLFIDFAVGIIPQLKVVKGQVWDVRFGIRDFVAAATFGEGEVRADLKYTEGKVRLRSIETGREVRLPARMFVPAGAGALVTPKNIKVRFVFSCGEITIAPGRSFANTLIRLPSHDIEQSMKDLNDTSRLIEFLAEVSRRRADRVGFWFKGILIGHLTLHGFTPSSDFLEWAKLVRQTWAIARRAEIEDELVVRISELGAQKQQIDTLQRVLDSDPEGMTLGGHLAGGAVDSMPFCMPYAMQVLLGAYRVVFAFVYLGHARVSDDGRLTMPVEQIRVHDTIVEERSDPPGKSIKAILEELPRRYESEYQIGRWWDDLQE